MMVMPMGTTTAGGGDDDDGGDDDGDGDVDGYTTTVTATTAMATMATSYLPDTCSMCEIHYYLITSIRERVGIRRG